MKRTLKQKKQHAKEMNEYYDTHPEYRKRKAELHKIWVKNHLNEVKEYGANYYQDNKPYLDKQNQDWYDKNYPHALEMNRKRNYKYEQETKIFILKHYGKNKLECIECHEKTLKFLTIHHIYGRKAEGHSREKSGIRLYRWLKIHNLPKGYQTLCYNCNCRKQFAKDIKIPKEFTNRYQKYYYNTFLPKAIKSKIECINHYTRGKNKCECCDEKNMDNLTIDHINGRNKIKHSPKQGGMKLWIWLQVNKFPKGFQILCYNCNSAKGNYGICPHKE